MGTMGTSLRRTNQDLRQARLVANQSQSTEKQNEKQRRITSDTQLKLTTLNILAYLLWVSLIPLL